MPAPAKNRRLLISFYGDDITGSTDSMEALARNGVETVLFLRPPEPEALQRFPGVQAVGVAGMTRTMAPDAMRAELGPALRRLQALDARICHYKICSTFDSSPNSGSIGCAIDLGAELFGTESVPLLVGAPVLRRYTLFGNLFATVGSQTHRIDRHPTMSRHPVTPMDEGDMRLHLGKQTDRRIGLLDILALTGSPTELDERYDRLVAGEKPGIVLFDVLDEARLAEAGRLIWRAAAERPIHAEGPVQLFACGSSGLEYALVPVFRSQGLIPAEVPAFAPISPVDQMLVVSGSCSPPTQAQLDWSIDQAPEADRFAGIDVNAHLLLDPERVDGVRQASVQQALALLEQGRSVVLYSARGPEDDRIRKAEAAWRARHPDTSGPGTAIGEQLGSTVHAILKQYNQGRRRLQRLVIAGGDTSGHCARSLGVEALQMIAPTAPGSPLCRAFSSDPLVDGLQIVLKGGQVGRPPYFTQVKTGNFA